MKPPLKLVLLQVRKASRPGGSTSASKSRTRPGHYGDVASEEALETFEENNSACRHALQDKVCLHGPGNEPWETSTREADSGSPNKHTTDLMTEAIPSVIPPAAVNPGAQSESDEARGSHVA